MEHGIIKTDLHGKNVYQAKITLDSVLKRAGGSVYIIHVIHGSSRGTAIRDMVREVYPSHPKVLRVTADGPDATDLILREI